MFHFILKIGAEWSSETMVSYNNIEQHHNAEDRQNLTRRIQQAMTFDIPTFHEDGLCNADCILLTPNMFNKILMLHTRICLRVIIFSDI
jgi:hypothetical protein